MKEKMNAGSSEMYIRDVKAKVSRVVNSRFECDIWVDAYKPESKDDFGPDITHVDIYGIGNPETRVCLYWYDPTDDDIYLSNLHVGEDERQNRMGTQLLHLGEDIGRELGLEGICLWTDEKDSWMHKWYEREGYRDIQYNSPSPDGRYWMAKDIDPAPDGRFRVYMMCGIPGSGKSTYIEEHLSKYPYISRDAIRTEMGMTESGKKAVGTPEQEREVTRREYAAIEKLCRQRKSFVVDDTFTKRKYRDQLRKFVERYTPYVEIIYMDTPLDVCIRRRRNDIGADIMKNIYSQMEVPTEDECSRLIKAKGY